MTDEQGFKLLRILVKMAHVKKDIDENLYKELLGDLDFFEDMLKRHERRKLEDSHCK